jgi:glycosyltransferase involved in cell wall biosynthesis
VRILLCCEFYYPSIGGVQVVMQQLAERFIASGHAVTVATTRLSNRTVTEINGVKIQEFTASGNLVSGMNGEIAQYQDYVCATDFDVIMIKAAQQWTFDALWPVLDQIKAAKVFIPCGFSGLYEPSYAEYFSNLPNILKKLDHLIFYASDYRDINFAKENGITNYSIVPNGASELEFSAAPQSDFRASLGVSEHDFLLLTVGSMTGLKGHLEVAKAFEIAELGGRSATLILNGNKCVPLHSNAVEALQKMVRTVKLYGCKYVAKHLIKTSLRSIGIRVGKDDEMETTLARIRKQPGKNVIVIDLPRPELVQAFMAADLFVFASNVEYSPLVLFESAAAGTPFLTVPVGNSEEIARWTGAGVVCPAERDSKGYTRVDPRVLASHIEKLVREPETLKKLGLIGKENWQEKFTWAKISGQYEQIFHRAMAEKAAK